MKYNIIFFIVGMLCLWGGTYIYNAYYIEQDKNLTENENILFNENKNISVNENIEEQIQTRIGSGDNTKKSAQVTGLNNQNNNASLKKDLFDYTGIKYPEILKFPGLVKEFKDFEDKNKNISKHNLELEKYSEFLQALYNNNLLISSGKNQFGEYFWEEFALYGMKDFQSQDDYECGLQEIYQGCFTIVTNSMGKIENIVFTDIGNIKKYSKDNIDYVLSHKILLGSAQYSLFHYSGKEINSLYTKVSGFDRVGKHGIKKGDFGVEFMNGSVQRTNNDDNNFQVVEISHNHVIRENILYKTGDYSFDIYENLLNGKNVDVLINGKKTRFSPNNYIYSSEISTTYQKKLFFELNTSKNGYTVKGNFLHDIDAQKISVQNCKQNNSKLIDEYYTLKKFLPGSDFFEYNISKEYGNYCKDGRYIFKIERENQKSIVAEIQIHFEE